MPRTPLTIGLFGFGCVGYGLYEVLQQTHSLKAEIKTICVKNSFKKRPLPPERFTFDRFDILNDPNINVVVELIDDAQAAYEIVSAALKKGKSVVSANKKMISEHLPELIELQKTHNVPFLYEAACCASIPIIRNLEEYYDNDLLFSLEAIANGTTNYILSKSQSDGISYENALQFAKELGYAETDPRLDVQGFDSKFKLVILMAHAFGLVINPNDVFHLGIEHIGRFEQRYASEKKAKIKLLAHAYKLQDGRIAAHVLPTFVYSGDKLYTVDDVFNGVVTQTSFADTQFFCGRGAGAHPTASAVLSDISALSYSYRYEYKKLNSLETFADEKSTLLKIMLKFPADVDYRFANEFQHIIETYTNTSYAYIIGTIDLSRLRNISQFFGNAISIISMGQTQHVYSDDSATSLYEDVLITS
jgi:homoserine dehydrogenase